MTGRDKFRYLLCAGSVNFIDIANATDKPEVIIVTVFNDLDFHGFFLLAKF